MEKLKQEVYQIMQEAEKQKALTGEAFNIYKVAGITHDEVKTCRIIYELINPNGAHHQGKIFLQMFLRDVLNAVFDNEELTNIKVFKEYHIPDVKNSNNDRRIDLVIQTVHRFIPIEVKLYAEDQVCQCKDYYDFAKKYQKEPCLYYLTIDGKKPSKESSLDIPIVDPNDGIRPGINLISFSREILIWLRNCQKYCFDKKLWPVYEVIRQFDSSIRTISGKMEDKVGMDISKKMIESSDSLSVAKAIVNNFQIAKGLLVNKVLTAIESKIDDVFCSEHALERNNNTKTAFYYKNIVWLEAKEALPGISYKYKNISLPGDKELWLRIEIDNCLYVGFIIYDPTDKRNHEYGDIAVSDDLSVEEKKMLNTYFGGKIYANSQEFLSWQYLTLLDGKEDRINFWHLNDDAIALCDDSTFNTNIEFMVKSIGEYIEHSIVK